MGAILQKLLAGLVVFGVVFAGPAVASKLEDQSGVDAPLGTRSIMSPAKISERTAPQANVCLEGEECGQASAKSAATEVAAATPEELYTGKCSSCHAAGVLSAPVTGNAEQWKPRIAKGKETLYKHAINGFNSMPAKGGCVDCSDEDIEAMVDYMISQSQ